MSQRVLFPDFLAYPAWTCPACGGLLSSDGISAEWATAVPPAIASPSLVPALLCIRTLSPRERVIFQLLGRGHDNRSLARVLGISERTVKRHITAILRKLRLESRLQVGLVALMAHCGLLPDQPPAGHNVASSNPAP